ncbi:MAG: hypothetical protein ABJN78_08110 [Hyphomicrobiales bacterium]
MDLTVISEINRHRSSGAIISFRRNRLGVPKIKIKHGPFKFLTKRIETDNETFEQIKYICRAPDSGNKL